MIMLTLSYTSIYDFKDYRHYRTDFHHACTKTIIQCHFLPHQLSQRSSTHGIQPPV